MVKLVVPGGAVVGDSLLVTFLLPSGVEAIPFVVLYEADTPQSTGDVERSKQSSALRNTDDWDLMMPEEQKQTNTEQIVQNKYFYLSEIL